MPGYNFTMNVRKALAMAREEALHLRHEYVGTEHILLGLTRSENGVAIAVLRNLSIDPEQIRQKVFQTVKRNESVQITGPDLPYTSRAKKSLELAMNEARELGHSYVGTEHLLLGLLGEEKGIGAQVLGSMGVTINAARQEVRRHPTVAARAASPEPEDHAVMSVVATPPRDRGAFVLLWMTLGIVILVESVPTILRAISGSLDANNYVALLAAVEVVGAILFLVPRFLSYGAWTLLAVFAVAIVTHLARGEFPAPLFVFAAGTYYVLTHKGPRPSC